MKKCLSILIAFVMLFSLSACDNNGNSANAAGSEDAVITTEPLTNPGEYLLKQCSSIKINDIEISLPTTYDKLNELFVLERTQFEPVDFSDYGYCTTGYNVFTKDNLYCGTIMVMAYDNGETFIRNFDENQRNDYFYLTEDLVYHLGDKVNTGIGNFKTLAASKKEIEAAFGTANIIDGEWEYYTFEDADIVLRYGNDILIGFRVFFK